MFLSLFYLTVLFHKSETLIQSLTPNNLHLQKLLDNFTTDFNELYLINCNIQVTVLPTMYFDFKKPPKLDTHKAMFVVNLTKTDLLPNLVQYSGIMEKAHILVLVKEEPDQVLVGFFQQNHIYQVVFVKLCTKSGKVDFLYIKEKLVQKFQDFQGWPEIPKVLRVCYSDAVPYTTIEFGQKGLYPK